jgi:hypothetical protein
MPPLYPCLLRKGRMRVNDSGTEESDGNTEKQDDLPKVRQ